MTVHTSITLEPSARATALLAKLRKLPDLAVVAVVAGMASAGQIVLGGAVRRRFTGKGPFPVAEHRLGVVTNRLRKSLRATKPQVASDRRTVEMRFGTDVSYFGIHEFGFKGKVQVRAHTRRSVAADRSAKGKVTRGEVNRRKNSILVQGRQGYAYVRAHTRNLTIAARAPLGTELALPGTRETFSREVGRNLRLQLDRIGNGGEG